MLQLPALIRKGDVRALDVGCQEEDGEAYEKPRRAFILAAAALLANGLQPGVAKVKTKEDVSVTNLLPKDTTLYELDVAPKLESRFACINCGERQQISLADFIKDGKYVVLWFFPLNGLASFNTDKEATNFEKLKKDFDDIDAVLLGCSSESTKKLREELIDKKLLTMPFLSDPNYELIDAFGARNPLGECFRQTFIISPPASSPQPGSRTYPYIRWIERNVDLGVGNFNLDNHASLVLREFFEFRNTDGWSV